MSSFLFPAGLALLLALPIILWLHLRRRRPRRVLVPSLAPWLRLLSETPPRRHRPPPSLLLFLHLLVALLLGLAAAGMRLPGGEDAAGDRVFLVDLTRSMSAESRWNEARDRAAAMIDSTSGSVGVVALSDSPHVLVARDLHGRNALDAIDAEEPVADFTRLEDGLKLAHAIAEPGAEIVLISDGGLTESGFDVANGIREERVGSPADNVAITRLAARETGGLARIFARVQSFSSQARSVNMRLEVDGESLEERVETLAPDQPFEAVWALPAGAREAKLSLEVDDAMAQDNTASVVLRSSPMRIQMTGESAAMRRALASLPGASVSQVGLGNLKADGSIDVSIFIGRVPPSLPPGGSVLVNLEKEEELELGANPISGRIEAAGDHPLVRGLDLRGVVLGGLRDPRLPDWAEAVLVAEGRLAMLAGTRDAGRQVVLAFDPDEGELGERIAFPLLIARILDWVAPGHDARARMEWTRSVVESDLRDNTKASAADSSSKPDGQANDASSGAGQGSQAENEVQTIERKGGRPLWPVLALLALLLLPSEAALRAGWFAGRGRPRSTSVPRRKRLGGRS